MRLNPPQCRGESPLAARLDSPSRRLLRFAQRFRSDVPILDAGCGFGRNAVALAQLGMTVVCLDRDRWRLRQLMLSAPPGCALLPVCANLNSSNWPFKPSSLSAVVCIHYVDTTLFSRIYSSLVPGGCLYLETVGGQGQNHLELPVAGQLRDQLSKNFRLEFYEERRAGAQGGDKRAVKLLGQKL